MALLRLNHLGDKVVAIGSVSGKRYEWRRPNRLEIKIGQGEDEIDERDVPELKEKKYKQGCDCSKHGGSYSPIEYLSYFEEIE